MNKAEQCLKEQAQRIEELSRQLTITKMEQERSQQSAELAWHENTILREELEKYRREYSKVVSGLVDINDWLTAYGSENLSATAVHYELAARFDFAFLKAQTSVVTEKTES